MQSTPALSSVSVSPTSLAAAFARVPDPRRAASVVYPLPAILALAVAAILADHLSVLAIAEWGHARTRRRWPPSAFPAVVPLANRRCSACFVSSMAGHWPRR